MSAPMGWQPSGSLAGRRPLALWGAATTSNSQPLGASQCCSIIIGLSGAQRQCARGKLQQFGARIALEEAEKSVECEAPDPHLMSAPGKGCQPSRSSSSEVPPAPNVEKRKRIRAAASSSAEPIEISDTDEDDPTPPWTIELSDADEDDPTPPRTPEVRTYLRIQM